MILVVATFLPVPRMWTHLETRSALNPDMSGSRYDLDQSYLIVLSRLTMTNSIHFLENFRVEISNRNLHVTISLIIIYTKLTMTGLRLKS